MKIILGNRPCLRRPLQLVREDHLSAERFPDEGAPSRAGQILVVPPEGGNGAIFARFLRATE